MVTAVKLCQSASLCHVTVCVITMVTAQSYYATVCVITIVTTRHCVVTIVTPRPVS